MADKTGIEWTDATWNPVTGCAKVSAGCKHCYAERNWGRLQHLPAYAGRAFTNVATHADRLDQPIRWAKRRMIFVNSMSDLFHPAVPDGFIDSVFGVMWACLYGRNEQAGHIFQVLTKRADRMRDYMRADRREAWAKAAVHHGGGIDPDGIYDQVLSFEGPHPRIWLGVSVENREHGVPRCPILGLPQPRHESHGRGTLYHRGGARKRVVAGAEPRGAGFPAEQFGEGCGRDGEVGGNGRPGFGLHGGPFRRPARRDRSRVCTCSG